MGHFNYPRHFVLLLAAAIVLFLVTHWDLFSEPFLPTFAASGALHAGSLVLTLRAPDRLWRKALFVASAALLSVMSFYVGVITLVALSVLPGNERLFVTLGICAATGAITYVALIRIFWLRGFSSRSILAIAIACAFAAMSGFLVRSFLPFLQGWWLAACWWFALSAALWYFDTHATARAPASA